MELEPYDKICRCCFAQGAYKDFHEKYNWMGAEEVYADILRECFEIKLTEEKEMSGICEVCITQLRNAYNFRKQVLSTEERFKQNLPSIIHGKCMKVEFEEVIHDDSDHAFEDDTATSYEYLDPETAPVTVKSETKPEQKKSKKKAAPSTPKKPPKRLKVETAETSTTSNVGKAVSKPAGRVATANKAVWSTIRISSTVKHQHNLDVVISNSNATPIKFIFGTNKFFCAYCPQNFDSPIKVKRHTLDEHTDIKTKYGRSRKSEALVAKLDITNLKCKLCDEEFKRLGNLKQHLIAKHDQKLYTDIVCLMQEYKFETDDNYSCVFCAETFMNIKSLTQHLNRHYRNFVCEECDSGFMSTDQLRKHKKYHDKPVRCEICDATFKSEENKRNHVTSLHMKIKVLRSKCSYCEERFDDYDKKEKHIRDVHGIRKVFPCNACEKTFNRQKALTRHKSVFHLQIRNFKCPSCDKAFYSGNMLRDHIRKHTGEKNFECDICHKRYGRRYTLIEHLRIHANDRRYKCSYCKQSFVQKCTLQYHMRARHNELSKSYIDT